MDLAKIERVLTYEHEFWPGKEAGTENAVNEHLAKGWVVVTSKIIQVGNERDGLRSQHCIVLGKPREPRPQTDLKDVGEVFMRKSPNIEAASNVINRYLQDGWVLQKLQPITERTTRDEKPNEQNYVLFIMVKPRKDTMEEKIAARRQKTVKRTRP